MFPKTKIIPPRLLWMNALVGVCAAAPASAQIQLTPAPAIVPSGHVICETAGIIFISGDDGACDGSGSSNPTTLTIGSGANTTVIDGLGATFNGFNSFTKSAQFSGNQAFSGTSAFNSTVTFTGPSVTFSTGTTFSNGSTFNALADFNNGITSNSITNSGAIATSTLTSGSVSSSSVTSLAVSVTDSLTVSNGATIDMGGNQVHGVAAGTADTDAVNVGQLNAATSGITADVTAIEAVNTTQSTQISNLQSGLATTNTNVANNSTNIAANTADIAANTADIATNTADIVDLQSGLADTNAALGIIDGRVGSLEALAIDFDSRLDDLKDRADVGTATAVALSGAMFLPGKTFNLTGNVGGYRGAVAGALQFGAMVSDRAAVNAGIAHGFNKGGKVAVRAGFTFGW